MYNYYDTETQIRNRVADYNNYCKVVREIRERLIPVLKGWQLQKVVLVSGGLSKRFLKEIRPIITEIEKKFNVFIYFEVSLYSFYLEIRSSYRVGDDRFEYVTRSLYVAGIDKGKLVNVELKESPTELDADEVISKINAINQMARDFKAEYEKAVSALPYEIASTFVDKP